IGFAAGWALTEFPLPWSRSFWEAPRVVPALLIIGAPAVAVLLSAISAVLYAPALMIVLGLAMGLMAAWTLPYVYLSANRGNLSPADAAFIQRHTAHFAARFIMTAFLLEKLAKLLPAGVRKAFGL